MFFFQDKSFPFCQLSFNYVLPKTQINSLFFFFFFFCRLNLLYQQLLTGIVSKPKLRRGMIISLLVYFIILKVVYTQFSSFPYCFDSYLIPSELNSLHFVSHVSCGEVIPFQLALDIFAAPLNVILFQSVLDFYFFYSFHIYVI